jgi:hypothetical protein
MDDSTYQQQWKRVKRWYRRLKYISENKPASESSKNDDDDVAAFFQNCYHLKDWIKNDPQAGKMRNEVEDYVSKSESLSICADICNGTKHLILDKSRSGTNPTFGNHTHRVYLNNTPILVCRGYTIVAGDKTFDAFDLAFRCMMDWHHFLSLNVIDSLSDNNV